MSSGNGNKDGLFSVLLRDYKAQAAASCMNRLAKLRYYTCLLGGNINLFLMMFAFKAN